MQSTSKNNTLLPSIQYVQSEVERRGEYLGTNLSHLFKFLISTALEEYLAKEEVDNWLLNHILKLSVQHLDLTNSKKGSEVHNHKVAGSWPHGT